MFVDSNVISRHMSPREHKSVILRRGGHEMKSYVIDTEINTVVFLSFYAKISYF